MLNPGEDQDKVYLFYDESSKRYFESTYFKVQYAEYEINRSLMMRDYVYLNEWYELLDIDTTPDGWALGWSTCMNMDMYWQMWLDFDHKHFTTEDGRECIRISFWQEPMLGFEDYC